MRKKMTSTHCKYCGKPGPYLSKRHFKFCDSRCEFADKQRSRSTQFGKCYH